MVQIAQGKVFHKCCSRGGEDACEPGPLSLGGTDYITDRDLFLSVVAELAEVGVLPDMVFVFNNGDQPFTDKTYWSPVPQFHWVQSAGHWTIPMPNPFQLRAHFTNRLGDSDEHTQFHVPWDQKLGKVFFRGSFSAPDYFLSHDLETLSRLRLLRLAGEHPDIFDVGITDVDGEVQRHMGPTQYAELMRRLKIVPHSDFKQDLPKFRYVLSVSAVLSSWRLSELLASGSLLLLQENADSELILSRLRPWEHFVPISNSLSDLIDKVTWLEAHPDLAQAMAARAFEVFRKRVRRQDTYCYIWQALSALHGITEGSGATGRTGKWSPLAKYDFSKIAPVHVRLPDLVAAFRSDTEL